ncbi:uncharacterized protein LOC141673730 [Apium graveolens]|uniref:uncharacterized protein LOC141673730 n=1 Tax=Apium graveolens TaxID=4045 RepID=UPI003D796DA2
MDETHTLDTFFDEFIDEFCSDDTEDNRRLELYHERHGQSSRFMPRKSIFRDREAVYPDHIFRQRFRMGRHVFLRIVDALSNVDPYFQQRVDAAGRKDLSPLQKCIAAVRMLAYGVSADAVDDYVRIGESIAVECLKKFVSDVIMLFKGEYLRKPNSNDVQRLLQMGGARGFPGMMGSIDCMHW